MAEKRMSVNCPKCGLGVELEKTFWGTWAKTGCPRCKTEIRMKDAENQIVECPSCRKEVVYNLLRKNDCPSCGHPLHNPVHVQPRTSVNCPVCQAVVVYANGDASATCAVCGKVFDPEAEARRIASLLSTDSSDVRMTGALAPDEIVWRHDRRQFALSDRIIAEPGMTAVCLQGSEVKGVVQGRSMLLSETDLRADAYAYGSNENKHVYADVYYVRDNLRASFVWGGEATMVGSDNVASKFSLFGRCELAPIADHAAFLRWIEFNTGVRTGDFALSRDERGVEKMGDYACRIRDAMIAVFGEALRNVRDRYNVSPEAMSTYRSDVCSELLKLVNFDLRQWGVAIRNVVLEDLTLKETWIVTDSLRARLEGQLNWRAVDIPVHLQGNPRAIATLEMNGTFQLKVTDDACLKRSTAAARWLRAGSNPREEIAEHIGEMLGSTFAAVFQQLINDMNPQLELLAGYAGFFQSQAAQIVNAPNGYLAEHGLCANQMTLRVKVASMSDIYRLSEQVGATITENELKEKLEDYKRSSLLERIRKEGMRAVEEDRIRTQTQADLAEGQKQREDIAADAAVHSMQAEQKRRDAERALAHKAAMDSLREQAEEDELRRRLSFGAWQEEARQAAAREAEAMESLRRRRDAEHSLQRDQANHDRAMHEIMRAVEESNQTWREKLDAYARLQRNLDAQDQRENQSAQHRSDAADEIYAGREALNLNAESARVMAEIENEAALRKEEMDKARFTRDLEMRRQQLAEEMEHLRVQYEQENKRAELAQENETLRMMLEYMVKTGDQQVRQATVEAQIASAKAAADRQQEEKLHQEAAERESKLAERAYSLTQEMLTAQNRLAEMEKENQRAYESGRAMVDAKGRQYQESQIEALVNQMNQLRTSVENMTRGAVPETSELTKWLENLLKGAGAAAPVQPQPIPVQPQAAPAAAAYTTQPGMQSPYGSYGMQPGMPSGRTCAGCGKPIAYSAVVCPHCHRSC